MSRNGQNGQGWAAQERAQDALLKKSERALRAGWTVKLRRVPSRPEVPLLAVFGQVEAELSGTEMLLSA